MYTLRELGTPESLREGLGPLVGEPIPTIAGRPDVWSSQMRLIRINSWIVPGVVGRQRFSRLQVSYGHHCTGTNTGAPLSFTRKTTNFAGFVLLAFRPTT